MHILETEVYLVTNLTNSKWLRRFGHITPHPALSLLRCTPLHWQIDTVDHNKQASIYWYSRKSLGYYYSTILAQAELSKATEIYSLTFSRPDGVVRTLLPPKSLGKILFLYVLQLPFATLLQFLPLWSCDLFLLGLYVFCVLLRRMPAIGFRDNPDNPGWSHLKILNCFPSLKTLLPNKITFPFFKDEAWTPIQPTRFLDVFQPFKNSFHLYWSIEINCLLKSL